MEFLLLHLSDIHFRKKDSDNPVLHRTDQIAAAVGSLLVKPAACFIVVSGDIAFSGSSEEYVLAEQFFTDLSQKLKDRLKLSNISLIIAPGNHDCDFTNQTKVREIILQDISQRQFDSSVIETCLQVQSNFWSFHERLLKTNQFASPVTKAFTLVPVETNGVILHFNVFNTALLSRVDERQGGLLFPLGAIPPVSQTQGQPQVVVSILHHPYNWFEPSNGRELRRLLESCSDIILTGHEHDPDSYAVLRGPREEVEYIEGAFLQDHRDKNESGFNITLMDVQKSIQRVHHFSWTEKERYEEQAPPTELPFIRNALRLRNQYALKPEFEEELLDPGANFTHSAKEKVTLEDVFVYPEVRILATHGEIESRPKLVREQISTFIADERHILLFGPDKSGKSTLAKVLFQDLRKRGFLPLFLSGGDFKKADVKSVRDVLRRVFEAQYSTPDFVAYTQLDSATRAIIVDDLQSIHLNSLGRDRILGKLEEMFQLVVLFGDDQSRFDDLINRKSDAVNLWDYTACQILPLGNLKRSDLIKKWVFLGRRLTHDEDELLRQAQAAERVISELVGRFITPSYPIFVLALLQQLEVQRRLDVTSTSGSYGFLYETLLTIALAQASKLKLDLDTQYSYLSELAFFFFLNHSKELLRNQVYDWHVNFCKDYGRRLELQDLLMNFCTAGILTDREGIISFKYPYLFYYFLGRYFRDHLEDETVQTSIAAMALRLHHEESANVLLFLTYLSKNPLIIDKIIESATYVFSSEPECNIETDTGFLGQMMADIPKLVLDGTHAETRRRNLLSKKDQNEVDTPSPPQELPALDEVETDERVADILKINVAFKTIQILGQIIRNYPGSLKASEKLKITNEAYSVGLRMLKFMLKCVEEIKEDIVQILFELIQEHHPTWSEERLKARVSENFFNLVEGITFVVMKHVADSVGDETLALTFDELLKNSKNPSYRFIDISIRLFQFSKFPKKEVINLYEDFSKRPFPAQLVRHKVWYFFYFYPAKFDLVQSVCKQLEISMQPSVLYDKRLKLLSDV